MFLRGKSFWRGYATETRGAIALLQLSLPSGSPGDRSWRREGSVCDLDLHLRFADETTLCQAGGNQGQIRSPSGYQKLKARPVPMNQRRSDRVSLQIRLIAETEIPGGTLARMEAFTLVVNAHGGLLELSLKLTKGQRLFLANPVSAAKEPCRVVSCTRARDGLFEVAFEFENPTPHFWPVSFPPADWELVRYP
jgi:hypothetical protein